MRFVEHTETFFTTDSPRRRLSWLFSALVRILHSLRKPEGWRLLALHLFEVLRYVWKHFVIVLLLLLPVMLLLGMPQGKDLILNLLHTSAEGGMPGYIIRVVWFLLMLALLAYAIWAIPRFYQEKEMNDRALAASGDGMTALLRARSTSSDFLRVLAVLPLLFYGLTFIVVIRVEHVPKVPFWAFNSLLGVLILLYSIGVVYGWHRLRHIGWLMFGVMVGIPLGFSTLLSSYPQKPEFAYAILGNGLLLIACLLFILFHRWERVFELPGHASLKVFLGKWADRFYYAALVLVLGGATMLALWQNTMCMTSIPVLVFFTATYVFLIHLVLYVFMKVQAPGKLAIIAILGAIMGIFFFNRVRPTMCTWCPGMTVGQPWIWMIL